MSYDMSVYTNVSASTIAYECVNEPDFFLHVLNEIYNQTEHTSTNFLNQLKIYADDEFSINERDNVINLLRAMADAISSSN